MDPSQRKMTNPAVGALNTPELLQDVCKCLTLIQLNRGNNILDTYNSPDSAAAADFYRYVLQKNSIATSRNFLSTAMSTTSAGRAAVGPVRLASAQLQLEGTPVGAAAPINAQNAATKFSNGF